VLVELLTPRSVFMDIGACEHALHAAGYAERVYAIDVSGHLPRGRAAPLNLRYVLCDGVRIPVPEASVDLAWGGDFMDQLDAPRAAEHLRSVRRCLVAGGKYLFTTAQPPAIVRRRLLNAGFSAVRIPLWSRFLKVVRIHAIK
jgi:hypothetical protein